MTVFKFENTDDDLILITARFDEEHEAESMRGHLQSLGGANLERDGVLLYCVVTPESAREAADELENAGFKIDTSFATF